MCHLFFDINDFILFWFIIVTCTLTNTFEQLYNVTVLDGIEAMFSFSSTMQYTLCPHVGEVVRKQRLLTTQLLPNVRYS